MGSTHRLRCQPGPAPGPLCPLPPGGVLRKGLRRNAFSPPSPLLPGGDLTGQKNAVLWEQELLAPVPGPSSRAPSLIRLVILPDEGGSGDQAVIGWAHRARRRSFLQDLGRKRWCGVASWARRQLRAKGERCARAKGQGEDNRGKNKQGEGRTEREVKLKQRIGELEKRRQWGGKQGYLSTSTERET